MSDFVYENDEQDPRGWRSDPFGGQKIDVPLGDVTDAPRQCVEISLAWVPIIISALERLKFGDMWNGDASEVERAANNIDTLQVMLADGECEGGNMDYTCYDMPLHSPIIDWLPADPFENDPPIPHGYVYPPWQIITVAEPLEGYRVGDVVVNTLALLTSFPPIIPTSGVPRMQITVQGPAEVDIEFARVFQGGIALVFVDGIPVHWVNLQLFNVADILNVNSWLELFGFAVDSFTRGPLEMPIELPDDQEYVVEIQMFPRPALDYTIGIGGGIRGISICSEREQVDMSPFVTDIRINDGTVEKQVDSVWSAVAQEDDDDVLTESDLRGQGCELQYYDLETSSWLKVPGTDFLNVNAPCIVNGQLIVEDESAAQIVARHLSSQDSIAFYHNGSTGVMQSDGNVLIWTPATGNRFDINPIGYFTFTQPSAPGNVHGMMTLNNNLTSPTLTLRSYNGSLSDHLVVRDDQNRITNQINRDGWFSAIQQLIVNDFTSTGAKRGQGRVLGQWADDTDATRKGRMIVQVDDFNGVREGVRIEADGTEALLGFFGSAAVAKQIVTGATARSALESLLTSFENLGLIDDQSVIVAGGEGTGVETRYEIYWDAKDHTPENDWDLTVGNWYITVGFQHAIEDGESTIDMFRVVTDGVQVSEWKIKVFVDNLTGGSVNVSVYETGRALEIYYETALGDGTHYLEIPIGFRFWANDLTLHLETDEGETALIIVSDLWERGVGMPTADEARWATEIELTTDFPGEWGIEED